MSQEDIYQTLGEIRAELRALVQYLHRHIDQHAEEHREIRTKLNEHEKYINRQTGAKAALLTAAALLGAFFSEIWQWITKRVNGG